MKAITCARYGSPDVLRLVELPLPVPAADEVLLKVHAASVNPLDWRLLRGRPLVARLVIGGLRTPRRTRPGVDVAGVVEAVGANVTRLRPGDAVFGGAPGAFAQYVCAKEGKLAPKPANLSFAQAASVPVAAISALQGLRDDGRLRRGQKVLIDGASGGVGTFAIPLAKWLGAEVTAVCSTGKLATARELGADHLIDYTQEDFTRGGRQWDLILAANAHRPLLDYRRALAPGGIFVMVGGGWPQLVEGLALGPVLSLVGRRKFRPFLARIRTADLLVLGDLLADGTLVPVIDRCYPLERTAEALRYLEEGHARGKVVIEVVADAQV